jgi:hypothetical protein
MGQHDPLDGLVTYNELLFAATRDFGIVTTTALGQDIEEMTDISRSLQMATDDPLGIGGLLSDSLMLIRIAVEGGPVYTGLLGTILDAALSGLDAFTRAGSLELPTRYRLPFRELGLSIGLAGIEEMPGWIGNNPEIFGRTDQILQRVRALQDFVPMKEKIEQFWLKEENHTSVTWTDHRDINTVMLATSLAPDGFLGI